MSATSNTPGEFFINHLFLSTLQELAQQANFQLNRKKAFAYSKAANSIRDHKQPLKSAEDARKLAGIGPKISQQLDFVLQKYYREQGKNNNAAPPKSGKEMVAWFLQGMGEEYTTLYSKLMLDNGYDNELILSNLTDEDLTQIGVALPGHRRTIMLKSQEMKNKMHETTPAPPNNNTNNTVASPHTSPVPQSRVAEQIIEQTLQLYPRDSLLAGLGISVHTNMGHDVQEQTRGLKIFQTARGGRLPAQLDGKFVENNCSPENYIKGHALFKADHVLLIVLNGEEMYGEIQARDHLYHVIITLSRGRVTKAVCECSYCKHGWCKHIVALLLAALECLERSRETGDGYVQVSAASHVTVPSSSDIFAMKNKLAQQRAELRQSATRVSEESDEEAPRETEIECDSSDIDSADLEEIDSAFRVVTPVKQRTPSPATKNKVYIPRYRSGAWAILLTMLNTAREEGEDDDTCQTLMSKDEIVMRARPLSNASFDAEQQVYDLTNKSTEELEREITCPGGYTAWSAMTKLRTKELVELKIVNNVHMFRLTKSGKDLAKKLFIASQHLDEDPLEISTPKRGRESDEEDRTPKRRRVDTCQTEVSNNVNGNNVEGPDPTVVMSPLKTVTPAKPSLQPGHVTDVRAILGSPHARVVLLIDNRELNRDTTRSLKDKLTELGVVCISRNLELGDMMWVVTDAPALIDGAHDPALDARQVVLNVIVERKTIGDLRASLADGRYKEQKFRLKKSGISRLLYVIEGALEDESFKPLLAAIQTSMSVHESIEPVRTKGEEDTAIYLSHVTQHLTRQLHEYRAGECASVPTWSTSVVLSAWWHSVTKSKHLTLSDLFAKQLLMLKQLTPQRVASIVQRYPTPRALIDAYNALEVDPRGREELIADLRAGSDKKALGPAVSKRVNLFYNHIGDNLNL